MLMSLLSLLSGFYFSPDETGGGSGDGEPGTGPGDQNRGNEPPPAPPAAPAQATTGTAPGDNGGNNGEGEPDADLPKTKDALDKRIEKAKRSGMRDILTALGFEDLDTPEAIQQAQADLQGLVEFARQQREANLSAEERSQQQVQALTQRAERAEQRAAQAERERDDAQQALVTKARHDAILRAAGSAKHPEDVIDWAEKHTPDLVATVLNEDGSVNDAVAKQIVTECAKSRRDWFSGAMIGVPSNHDGRPPASFAELDKKMELARQAARQAAR